MKVYPLVLLFAFCSSSYGLTTKWNTAEHFSENKDDALFIAYTTGAGNAILAMNVALIGNGHPPMYCQPNTLALNYQNYIDIAEKEIPNAKKVYGQQFKFLPIENLVMDGLRNTFPCMPK